MPQFLAWTGKADIGDWEIKEGARGNHSDPSYDADIRDRRLARVAAFPPVPVGCAPTSPVWQMDAARTGNASFCDGQHSAHIPLTYYDYRDIDFLPGQRRRR